MKSWRKAGWYELSLPDHWEADEDDTPVAFWQPDGAGALQVTAEQIPRRKESDRMDCFLALRAFLSSTGHELDESSSRRFSRDGLQGACTEYSADAAEENLFWRVWFVTDQETLLFLTYACREEERELEREAVDSIVDSVRLIG